MQQHNPGVVGVRSRLRDERGFSLLELQVAELLGGFVIATALMMMIVAVNAADRVTDRVNAAQVGRLSMEQIQQRVRSQTCLFPGEYAVNGSTLAAGAQASIIHAGDQKIVFIGDLSATGGATNVTGSVGFRPQMRYIYMVTDSTGRRGRLVEGWRNATTTTAPYNFSISPSVNFNALANAAAMNGVAPSTQRAMADGITNMVGESAAAGATGPTVPLFRYYDAAGAQIAINGSIGGVPTSQLGAITRVTVGFKVVGASGKDKVGAGPSSLDNRTASFRNEIYLRTIADRCL